MEHSKKIKSIQHMRIGGIIMVVGVMIFLFLKIIGSQTETETFLTDSLGLPLSPLNASYKIADKEIRLQDGSYTDENIHVSSSNDIFYGDVNSDGINDAVLILTVSENNEDRMYLALALNDDGGYLGLETLPLEQTQLPQTVTVVDQYITLSYISPSSPESSFEEAYYSLVGLQLEEISLSEEDTIYKGYYVYNDDSRVFTPCDSEEEYWISPDSVSRAALEAIYKERTRELEPTTRVYVVLTGHITESPQEGFGVDYNNAFVVTSILSVPEKGTCNLAIEK